MLADLHMAPLSEHCTGGTRRASQEPTMLESFDLARFSAHRCPERRRSRPRQRAFHCHSIWLCQVQLRCYCLGTVTPFPELERRSADLGLRLQYGATRKAELRVQMVDSEPLAPERNWRLPPKKMWRLRDLGLRHASNLWHLAEPIWSP